MNLDSLKLFREIARTRSFSRAAEANGVSQSAASQQIQEVERYLGVTLLDRSRRPLLVTPAGELYSRYCQDLIERHQELEDTLARLRQQVEGVVRVACIYSVGVTEIVQLEREFIARYPQAEVKMQYLRPEKVYAAVLADQADLGVVSYPSEQKDLTVIPWRREEMVLVAAPTHPLAVLASRQQGPLAPEELEGVNFIGFDEDLPIRRHIDRFFKEQGVEVKLVLHFDNIEMIKDTVEHGVGVSLIPFRAMRDDLRQKRLTAIRLRGEGLYRPLGIIHRKRKKLHRVSEVFLELMQARPVAELGAA